jgi:hypothetical protein
MHKAILNLNRSLLRAEMIEQTAQEMAHLLTEFCEDKVRSVPAFKRQVEDVVCRFNMSVDDWDGSSSEEG